MQFYGNGTLFSGGDAAANAWAGHLLQTVRDVRGAVPLAERAARIGRVAGKGGMLTGLLALGACSGGGSDGFLSGLVSDDPVAFSTAFQDTNNNNTQDAGEPSVQSDSRGNFALSSFPNDPAAQLVATSGVDTVTGLPLDATLLATPNSAVISPLTTLVQLSGGNESAVKAALGLAGSVNLATFDANAALAANPADTAAQDVLAAQRVVSAVVNGVEATAGVDSLTAFQAVANALAGGAPVSLADASVIDTILSGAGVTDAALRAAAAQAIADTAARIEGNAATPFTDAAVNDVIATHLLLGQALEDAAANPSDAGLLRELTDRFTGSGLDDTFNASDAIAPPETGQTDIVTGLDFAKMERDAVLTLDAADVVANDLDLTGNGTLTVTGVTDNSAGIDVTYDAVAETFTVTALNGFTGITSFDYTVQNSVGDTGIGRVAVRVRDPRFTTADGGETLEGSNNADVLAGGGNGNDVLLGRGGDDILFAVLGNDAASGGSGNDAIFAVNNDGSAVSALGGSGADEFILAALTDSNTLDVTMLIGDFNPAEDLLDVSRLRAADGSALTVADILGRASANGSDTDIDLSGLTTDGGQSASAQVSMSLVAPGELNASNIIVAGSGPSPSELLGDLVTLPEPPV